MSPPQPELETDLLFVYGTLRRGRALHHHLKRLGAEFIAIGKAQAELFDLGKHPGARGSARAGKLVTGEIYRLQNAGNTFRVLDHLEGISAQSPEKCLFQRATTEVTRLNGEFLLTWIYWLNARAPRARRLPGGNPWTQTQGGGP